jgi:hypothetical protein
LGRNPRDSGLRLCKARAWMNSCKIFMKRLRDVFRLKSHRPSRAVLNRCWNCLHEIDVRPRFRSSSDTHTLAQLHSELAGKLSANQHEAKRLRLSVMKMLSPDVNLRRIAAKRCNAGNPWFKRGTLYRSVVDALRRSTVPMTARDIADAVLAARSRRPPESKPSTCRPPSFPRYGTATERRWLARGRQRGGGGRRAPNFPRYGLR